MADTLKEIYNGTVTFGNYINNKQTLVTGNSTTQYVIKDVRVSANSGYLINPELLVNNASVASLGAAYSSSSGSEIVDINNDIEIKHSESSTFLFNIGSTSTIAYSSGFTDTYDTFPSFSSKTKTATTDININTALSGGGTTLTCWIVEGNFYYLVNDGNSNTAFYKRTGGVNGTQTTIHSVTYSPVVFDGVSKFYYIKAGSYYYVYDAITNTETAIYVSGILAPTTYPTLTYCAGYLLYQNTYTAANTIAINLSSSTATVIGSIAYSSQTSTFAFNDSVNKVMRIIYPSSLTSSSSGSYIEINYSSTPVLKQGYTSITFSGSYYHAHKPYSIGNFNIFPSANTGEIVVLDSSMKVIGRKTVAGGNFTSTRFPVFTYNTSPSTADLNTYGPSISLRITGIKSTI